MKNHTNHSDADLDSINLAVSLSDIRDDVAELNRSVGLLSGYVYAASPQCGFCSGSCSHPSCGHPSCGHPSCGHPSCGHPSCGHPSCGGHPRCSR